MFAKLFGSSKKKKRVLKAQVSAFHSFGGKENLLSSPLPTAVLSHDKKVVWYNSLFSTLIPDIASFEKAAQENKTLAFLYNSGEKYIDIIGKEPKNTVKTADKTFIIYAIDRTIEMNLSTSLNGQLPIVCNIMIDNYDDLVKSLSDKDKLSISAVFSEIDEKIDEWVNLLDGSMIKYEKDKYLITFQKSSLEEQIAEKFKFFDVFDEISKKYLGNASVLSITLSVGIGDAGGSFSHASEFAMAALDMAQGRGGDQVVVKNDKDFQYFGGRTIEVEKRTKVKPRLISDALQKLFPKNGNVYLMGHAFSDADSIGAMAGLVALIRHKGLHPKIIINQEKSLGKNFIKYLAKNKKYKNVIITPDDAAQAFEDNDLLILVDCHRADITECPDVLKMHPKLVLIDHHRRDANFISNTVLTYHEPYASSTCEMVVEILQYIDGGVDLEHEEVQCLYAGIILDTRNFIFKTGVRTFEAATFLRASGADPIAVKKLYQVELDFFTKRAEALQKCDLFKSNIAIAKINDVPKSQIGACADDLLQVKDIEAAFVLKDCNGFVEISARSLQHVNVQTIIEQLGGGGHATSSGAKVEGSYTEVKNKLIAAINKSLEGSK